MRKKWQSGRVAPNIRETPSNIYSQLQNARLDPVRHLEQRQRRDHQLQRTFWTASQTLLACVHWLFQPAPLGLSQNTWVFWELLTSLHLFSIYSKRVPISGRLWGSAAIYMINKRMFYLFGMWVYFFAWNVFDCTWSVLDCTSLVKDYMAILASMKSAKSDLWSWKTRFKSLKNSHL